MRISGRFGSIGPSNSAVLPKWTPIAPTSPFDMQSVSIVLYPADLARLRLVYGSSAARSCSSSAGNGGVVLGGSAPPQPETAARTATAAASAPRMVLVMSSPGE